MDEKKEARRAAAREIPYNVRAWPDTEDVCHGRDVVSNIGLSILMNYLDGNDSETVARSKSGSLRIEYGILCLKAGLEQTSLDGLDWFDQIMQIVSEV